MQKSLLAILIVCLAFTGCRKMKLKKIAEDMSGTYAGVYHQQTSGPNYYYDTTFNTEKAFTVIYIGNDSVQINIDNAYFNTYLYNPLGIYKISMGGYSHAETELIFYSDDSISYKDESTGFASTSVSFYGKKK